MKNKLIAVALVVMLLGPGSALAAESVDSQLRAALQSVIALLIEQVRVLTIQLAEMQKLQGLVPITEFVATSTLPEAPTSTLLEAPTSTLLEAPTSTMPEVVPVVTSPAVGTAPVERVPVVTPRPVISISYENGAVNWTAVIEGGETLTCEGKGLLEGQSAPSGSVLVTGPGTARIKCSAQFTGNTTVKELVINP